MAAAVKAAGARTEGCGKVCCGGEGAAGMCGDGMVLSSTRHARCDVSVGVELIAGWMRDVCMPMLSGDARELARENRRMQKSIFGITGAPFRVCVCVYV